MSNSSLHGIVTSAELCAPLKNVELQRLDSNDEILEITYSDEQGAWQLNSFGPGERLIFSLNGFTTKKYRYDHVLNLVRLLENRLIGYLKKLWFIPGELVEAYIHSPEPFIARLFRHGYQKKCIKDLDKFDMQIQQVPDSFFVESGLNWKKTFTFSIPNDAEPGIYSLLLESADQEPFAIPMVISTHPEKYGQKAKILVLASTNTWQSYNLWGGRSRYRNFEDNRSVDFLSPFLTYYLKLKGFLSHSLPEWLRRVIQKIPGKHAKHSEWMFKKLSIRRPFTNCNLEETDPLQPFTNHLAAGEWRLLAWLEREGYSYDIISGYELHNYPELLNHYKCLILNTHCEYWTGEMFERLKGFHEKKRGWILNVSGNSIFREIEFFDDGSTRCVSLSFKDSYADEALILGVRFSMSDYATCAPYKILKPYHWIFSGVSSSSHKTFGGLSLNQNTKKRYSRYDAGRPGVENSLQGSGASGWETDKICQSAPRDIKVVAKGLNPGGGADMVIRDPNGVQGGMFSASSILFSGSLLIDNICSMIFKNVLERALKDKDPD